jgi:hypothetical protein
LSTCPETVFYYFVSSGLTSLQKLLGDCENSPTNPALQRT